MSLDPRPSDADLRRIAAERWAARGYIGVLLTQEPAVTRAQGWGPYRSKWEWQYASRLRLERAAGLILAWQYEPRRFTIGVRRTYKPDFRVVSRDPADGRLRVRYVEIKGNIHMRNARDGVTRLAAAALRYPQYTWEIATIKQGAWIHTRIAA